MNNQEYYDVLYERIKPVFEQLNIDLDDKLDEFIGYMDKSPKKVPHSFREFVDLSMASHTSEGLDAGVLGSGIVVGVGYVHYLMRQDPDSFIDFLLDLKNGK